MRGVSRCDLANGCALNHYHCTRGYRAHRTPGIPCALFGRKILQDSGISRRGIAQSCLEALPVRQQHSLRSVSPCRARRACCNHHCRATGPRRDFPVPFFFAIVISPRSNSMTHAIRFHKPGGPEVLVWEEVNLGRPGPGEARIPPPAVGLNFVDIYNRSGLYPVQLPSGLGGEAAGVVEEVGPGVTDLKVGDRVAYGAAPLGAYAEARLIPADRLLKLPDGIDDKTAAAMMLKGLTTQYLIRQTYRVKSGDTILLHAAAGGVGLILGQWAKHLGATVIGTVGSDEKAKLAKAHGCAHTIVYTREDFVKRVEEITEGKKVPVVYDSVGKDTFLKSLDCLAPLGVAA